MYVKRHSMYLKRHSMYLKRHSIEKKGNRHDALRAFVGKEQRLYMPYMHALYV